MFQLWNSNTFINAENSLCSCCFSGGWHGFIQKMKGSNKKRRKGKGQEGRGGEERGGEWKGGEWKGGEETEGRGGRWSELRWFIPYLFEKVLKFLMINCKPSFKCLLQKILSKPNLPEKSKWERPVPQGQDCVCESWAPIRTGNGQCITDLWWVNQQGKKILFIFI